jgi:hypothetical protein
LPEREANDTSFAFTQLVRSEFQCVANGTFNPFGRSSTKLHRSDFFMKTKFVSGLVMILAAGAGLGGCSHGATRGGLIGGTGGAVVGSATGLGTAEGAVIGGTAGAVIGDK